MFTCIVAITALTLGFLCGVIWCCTRVVNIEDTHADAIDVEFH